MDPLIVFDCENAVPNRFALAVAAAGRARALSRGAEPRVPDEATAPVELALREIAGNRFQPDEVKPFLLAGSVPRDVRVRPGRQRKLRGGEGQSLAAAPAFGQRAVH
ncbi:MAG: DNA-directed RNA polymerase subunit omega [Mesorhizobium sp.]|nr:MAG: DNA-directed RNA polymerase subunit omega [Mesorhizobium sp.]